ncbi:hypothetical protein NDU88_002592 [Pleurodeles waltl]|uniref:Uncharacterized protein n=1 Tax=Pleurodeles waltl TaxID=8319 RepID=A0AAV7M4D4_PLEWA|nr:hypothetical protein NDU88_002592 [Pleurodeles waltl]
MGTLITQAKRRMEEQIIKIEQLTKELEKMPNQQEISNQLAKMEERIKYKEEEIKSRKAHKFNRDKMDYEHGRIYTFARKYDTARTKDMSKSGADCAVPQISADDSSEIESSADELPRNKLDFQGEMRLMQMVTPPPGQNRRRGRGSGRRGGGAQSHFLGRAAEHQSNPVLQTRLSASAPQLLRGLQADEPADAALWAHQEGSPWHCPEALGPTGKETRGGGGCTSPLTAGAPPL